MAVLQSWSGSPVEESPKHHESSDKPQTFKSLSNIQKKNQINIKYFLYIYKVILFNSALRTLHTQQPTEGSIIIRKKTDDNKNVVFNSN